MRSYIFPAALVFLAQTVPAWAQSDPRPASHTDVIVPAEARTGDGDPRSGFVTNQFQLRADNGDAEASITLSSAQDNRTRFGSTSIALRLTAPITNKSASEGYLLTHDGVPGGFGASVSLFGLLGSYEPPNQSNQEISDRLFDIAEARCHEKARRDGITTPAEIDKKCGGAGLGFSTWGFDYLTPDERAQLRAAEGTDESGFYPQSFTFWNISAAVNAQDFKFADPTSFVEDKLRKVGFSGSASVGFSPSPTAPFFLASVEYRETWEAPDELIRCPSGGGAPVDCIKGAFGAPTKNIDYKASALVRVADIFGPILPVAVELKGSYDAKDDQFGIELPVYTFFDSDRKLKGGFRVGWDSKHDDVRIGVFVGTPFDLFKH